MRVPKSPSESLHGIVYFPRMVDKIRLHSAGDLREDLHANLGKGFDDRCCKFLQVDYADIAVRVNEGMSDGDVLEWCFGHGLRPSEEQIEVWSEFMRKRGWKDAGTEMLIKRKAEGGFTERGDIDTMFKYIDADEGR
jgi:gluconokinase